MRRSPAAEGRALLADWQPIEIQRATRRCEAFKASGLSVPGDAEVLAVKMIYRDRDKQDTRRVCFECANFTQAHGKTSCAKGELGCNLYCLDDPRYVLQRCSKFKLRGV